jgi:HSP20 family protein
MSIQIRSKQTGGAVTRREPWDPGSWARELLRWDPFREIVPTMPGTDFGFVPAFEVKENQEGYVFKADIPGVPEKDLDITRTGNRLTVSGKRDAEREEKGETFYAMERSYGSFTRAFTLPEGIDGEHIRAELREGVLTLVVPKMPESQPQKISVAATKKS